MCSSKALLLNASNMESFPIYPYAFIQVSAMARRVGVELVCKDLLGIPQHDWPATLQRWINEHAPEMILVTLRNMDSHVIEDYSRSDHSDENRSAYFPVERTKALIEVVRKLSSLKVAVGGFGFSMLPETLMHTLRPDFGIFGGGDSFFAHFDDLKRGVPAQAANLLYFQEGGLVTNRREFFPPFAECEYNSKVIEEMMTFYETFSSPGFDGAPVEVLRGCPFTCLFCSEPHVLGAQVRYRPLDAVMADIEILVDHGITNIYMISSELNPQGNSFVLQLADRIQRFNARQPEARRITWYGANYLLGFSAQQYEQLYASGFTGGWFDITALEDKNARAMRTPYRNARLLPDLKVHAHAKRKYLGLPPISGEPQSATVDSDDGIGGDVKPIKWTMFLGNPATTIDTIRETLRIADQEGLPQLFNRCYLNTNIRVFDYEEPGEDVLAVTFSVNPQLERKKYQPLLPSFAYPPALLEVFGLEEQIETLFAYLSETYLSSQYQETRDWVAFLRGNASVESIEGWKAALSTQRSVNLQPPLAGSSDWQSLFVVEERSGVDEPDQRLAQQLVEAILSASFEAYPGLLEHLGLPGTYQQLAELTPYKLAVQVYTLWDSQEQLSEGFDMLVNGLMGETMQECLSFSVRAILHRFNLRIRPDYRALFVESSSY